MSFFYTPKRIDAKNATYNLIIGERSSGKTYSILKKGVKQFLKTGEEMAYIRRWQDDFTGKRGANLFNALVSNGEISKLSDGEWTGVYYFGSRWYLSRLDENGALIKSETPFCYGFALTAMEHDKSTSFPNVTLICFDEFISRSAYLPDEFVLFMNTLSTIIRHRKNVKIYMLGNTVNKYCVYFKEMGLTHVKDMKPGDIDLYRYGNSELTVAVEYTVPNTKGKDSDYYFAFDNPKLSMITGGAWEIDVYPHCPVKFLPKEILFKYYIVFDETTLECEIIQHEDTCFTFIHEKTTPLKYPDTDLIYSPEFSARPNWRRKITMPETAAEKRIVDFYKQDKVFYSNNEIGEVVRNYLIWCGKAV